MPNRYIERYRQLKSARLKYKNSSNNLASVHSDFSSFIDITKVKNTALDDQKTCSNLPQAVNNDCGNYASLL